VARTLQGPDSDAPAQARLAAARGDIDGAIRVLKDETDKECRSTLLSIIVMAHGVDAGFKWLKEVSLTPGQLSSTGIHALAAAYLREEDSEPLRQLLTDLSEDHFKTCPFLFLLRALASVASTMPKPDQSVVFQTPQLVVRDLHPILPDPVVSERLSLALADLASIAPVLTELALPEVKRIADNLRISATMIDELLRVKLQSFLTDKTQISNLLRETRCRPAEIGSGPKIASKLADSLTFGSPMAQGVADLLARVTASRTSLKISIKRDRLLATLRDKFVEQSQDNGQDNIISLEVTVPAVSGGGSSKFIFEDQNAKTPDTVVVKAIARASVWFEQLTTGKSQSMAQIALAENITDNYVSNLIHVAWLSPDLVGRVLQGDAEATALARTALLTRKSEALWRGR
jgi:hypothetical protein